jgi:hypothetical protein
MAEEKKKSTKSAPAASAGAAAAPTAKPAKAPKAAKARTPGSLATPSAPEGERCSVDKCKQPVRAKGYCRKHYIAWRRGDMGNHHRYNICSKEGCRKPAVAAGLCEEHKRGASAAPAAAAG